MKGRKWDRKHLAVSAVVVLFGTIGVITGLISRAATPTASIDVGESSTVSGGASAVSDTSASGDSAIRFTAPTMAKPNASSTGVPSGHTPVAPMTDAARGIAVASDGTVTITKSGVFENMLVKGRLNIRASNVTIRYSRIEATPVPWDTVPEPTSQAECTSLGNNSKYAISLGVADTATGQSRVNLVVEDSEIAIQRKSSYVNAIHGDQYTLRRVDISGAVDAIGMFSTRSSANILVEDSFIHDLYLGQYSYAHGCDEATHSDGIQIHYGSGFVIRRNNIQASAINWNGQATNSNAAIMVNQASDKFTSNLLVENNWIDYGACSVNVADNGKTPTVQYLTVQNNKFGKNQQVTTGSGQKCAITYSGPIKTNATNIITGNVWEDGSLPAPSGNQ